MSSSLVGPSPVEKPARLTRSGEDRRLARVVVLLLTVLGVLLSTRKGAGR